MPNEYIPGQGVLVRAEFYDRNGAVVDPTTVTLTYKKPDTSAVVSIVGVAGGLTKISTGIYEYVIDTSAGPVGDWHYKFAGTGAAVGANEGVFFVRRSQLA